MPRKAGAKKQGGKKARGKSATPAASEEYTGGESPTAGQSPRDAPVETPEEAAARRRREALEDFQRMKAEVEAQKREDERRAALKAKMQTMREAQEKEDKEGRARRIVQALTPPPATPPPDEGPPAVAAASAEPGAHSSPTDRGGQQRSPLTKPTSPLEGRSTPQQPSPPQPQAPADKKKPDPNAKRSFFNTAAFPFSGAPSVVAKHVAPPPVEPPAPMALAATPPLSARFADASRPITPRSRSASRSLETLPAGAGLIPQCRPRPESQPRTLAVTDVGPSEPLSPDLPPLSAARRATAVPPPGDDSPVTSVPVLPVIARKQQPPAAASLPPSNPASLQESPATIIKLSSPARSGRTDCDGAGFDHATGDAVGSRKKQQRRRRASNGSQGPALRFTDAFADADASECTSDAARRHAQRSDEERNALALLNGLYFVIERRRFLSKPGRGVLRAFLADVLDVWVPTKVLGGGAAAVANTARERSTTGRRRESGSVCLTASPAASTVVDGPDGSTEEGSDELDRLLAAAQDLPQNYVDCLWWHRPRAMADLQFLFHDIRRSVAHGDAPLADHEGFIETTNKAARAHRVHRGRARQRAQDDLAALSRLSQRGGDDSTGASTSRVGPLRNVSTQRPEPKGLQGVGLASMAWGGLSLS